MVGRCCGWSVGRSVCLLRVHLLSKPSLVNTFTAWQPVLAAMPWTVWPCPVSRWWVPGWWWVPGTGYGVWGTRAPVQWDYSGKTVGNGARDSQAGQSAMDARPACVLAWHPWPAGCLQAVHVEIGISCQKVSKSSKCVKKVTKSMKITENH